MTAPTTNHTHQMFLSTAANGAGLSRPTHAENPCDSFLHHNQNNSSAACNSIALPNNTTLSIPIHLKNIEEYQQLMSSNLINHELTADVQQKSKTNGRSTTAPVVTMSQPNPNTDQLSSRKGSLGRDPINNEEDENDIFELMEDLKSELKFTFEEEIDVPPFPEAALPPKHASSGSMGASGVMIHPSNNPQLAQLPNQQSNVNNQTASTGNGTALQYIVNPSNHRSDFHSSQNPSVGVVVNGNNGTHPYPMDRCQEFVSNAAVPNGARMQQLSDYNTWLYSEQNSLPMHLLRAIHNQGTTISNNNNNNLVSMATLDPALGDMKMSLQSQQQSLYMLNPNSCYAYQKNCDASLAPHQYNLATSANLVANNKVPLQNNNFYYSHIRRHPHLTPHVKKPLNAFMLYMKDVRPNLIKETNTKDSIAINKIIGKMWQSLSKNEQAKYFEMARNEREIHRQLYPNYTTCDQYIISKKKRRKRDKTLHDEPLMKKCRARFGLDNQDKWCKPCRRKKKCIRFLQDDDQHPNNAADNAAAAYDAAKKISYNNNYAKHQTSPLKSNSDNDDPDLNSVQETLNSTAISPNNFSTTTAATQQHLFPTDYPNNIGTDSYLPGTITGEREKAFTNDTLFPASNTINTSTTTSNFNESLVDLLGHISPIPFKHDLIPRVPKRSTITFCADGKNNDLAVTASNVSKTEKNHSATEDCEDKTSVFNMDPSLDSDRFETNFNLDDSDVFKLEDISDPHQLQQPTSSNTSPLDHDPDKNTHPQ